MVIRQQRELQCKIKDIESLENKIGSLTAESGQLRMASQHSERLVAEAFATTKVAKNRYDIELMKNQALQSTVQANEEKIYSQQKTIVAHKEKVSLSLD